MDWKGVGKLGRRVSGSHSRASVEVIALMAFLLAVVFVSSIVFEGESVQASPDFEEIEVDSVSDEIGIGSTITISHTTTGNNRLMLVGISARGASSYPVVSGVTYNTVPLSLVDSKEGGGYRKMWIYQLVAPDTGTYNVVVSFSITPPYGGIVGVTTFIGVDQNDPLGTFASNSGTSTSASVNVSSAENELVFDTISGGSYATTITVGESQTERWNRLSEYNRGGGSTELGDTTVTMSWSLLTNVAWCIGAVPIKPAVSPPWDYPAKGADYLHRGVAYIENDPEFVFLWRTKILGTYDEFSGPIVVGGKVWIANKGDNIFRCLELQTGSLMWSYQLNASTDGAPLWFDNKIYVGTGNVDSDSVASLYCFNADNGDNLWKYDGWNNNYFASTPWINTDNRIIYWVDGQYLRALNVDNGELLWSNDIGGGSHPYTGVYYDGVTYCPGLIRAYNAENGDFLWNISGAVWDSGITVNNENVDNVVLYVGRTNPAEVWAVNSDNEDNYWVKVIDSGDKYLLGVPAIWENKVYITGNVGTITVLNKENGDIVWENADGTIFSSPTILPSGKVVYVNNGGTLRVRNADNGDLLWTYGIGTSYAGHIAVVDNYMLVPSDLGYLWAFGLGNVPPNSPTGLLTENQTNPTNLADNIPTFSAVFTDNDIGDFVRHMKIEVGTTEGSNDKWASDILELPLPRTENNENSYPVNYGVILADGFENLDGWSFTSQYATFSYGITIGYGTIGWAYVSHNFITGSPAYSFIKKEFDLTDVDTIFIDYTLRANTGSVTAKIMIGSDTVWSLQTMVGTKSDTEKEIPLENSYGIENVTIGSWNGSGGANSTFSVNRLQFLKPSNLEKDITYYWRTRFVDENGKDSAWSTETATLKITAQEYERPVEQGFSLAGITPREGEFGRMIEQGFSMGAVISITIEICKLLSQAFGFTGAIGVTFGWGKSLAQDFSLDGEVEAKTGYGRLISQDFSLTESIMIETAIVGRLWISDGGDLIYEVATDDPETIIDSYDFGTAAPFGCEENDGYIFFVDYGTDMLYKKLWSNKSEDNSWDISGYCGTAYGFAYGGGYFWVANRGSDEIYKVDPADPTNYLGIFDYTGIGYVSGLDWNSDNNRLLVSDDGSELFYSFDVSTVPDNGDGVTLAPDWTKSPPASAPTAIVWDGTYFWSIDDGTNLLYKHYDNGDVVQSYDPPGGDPQGLAFAVYVPPPPPTEYEYPIEQGFSLTGLITIGAEFGYAIEQSFSIGGVVMLAIEIYKPLSQEFSFTGSITAEKEIAINLSDAFSLSATVTASISFIMELSEELSFTATVEPQSERACGISQGYTLTGVVAALFEFSRSIPQDFSLGDEVAIEVERPLHAYSYDLSGKLLLMDMVAINVEYGLTILQEFSFTGVAIVPDYGDIYVSSPWCDNRANPTNVVVNPTFSVIYTVIDNNLSNPAQFIRIQVGTSWNDNDLWDNIATVVVENGQRSPNVSYDGIPLTLNSSYWWRCRLGDSNDNWTEWTSPQTFGYTEAPFDLMAAAMFIFPIVLMAMAFVFDNPVFAAFAGIVFILSGFFFICIIWLGILFVGIGMYLMIIAFLSEDEGEGG